jgi:putative membrane protein (TIGR04086 family)
MKLRVWMTSLLFGLISIFILQLVSSLLLSFVLRYTDILETSVSWIITLISFLTILIGGLIAGVKAGEKGWLIGGIMGLLFSAIVYSIQISLANKGFAASQWTFHAGFLAVAMLGGIIGVNMNKMRHAG